MNKNNKEATVESLVEKLNQEGKGIPVKLSQIESFPYSDFSDLLNAFQSGEARLLRFSFGMESSIFSLLASASDSFKNTLGLFVAFGGSFAAIVFSFIYSWWLLIIIPLIFFIGISITKKTYNSTIFQAAFSSEIIFCFLYFTGQISIDIPKLNKQFYYQNENTKSQQTL